MPIAHQINQAQKFARLLLKNTALPQTNEMENLIVVWFILLKSNSRPRSAQFFRKLANITKMPLPKIKNIWKLLNSSLFTGIIKYCSKYRRGSRQIL